MTVPALAPCDAARYWFDPALPFAESRRACNSRANYLPHTHSTLSIGAVDGGHSVFTCDRETLRLAPGAVVVVPAGQVHACNPLPDDRWSYQMLHVDADWADAVARESLGDARGARPGRHVRVTGATGIYRLLCGLNAVLFSDADSVEKEAALVAFLGDLHMALETDARGALRPAALTTAGSRRVARLKALLDERHAERLPLAELAQTAGMSRYQLIRAFRAETGMTPHAYQLDIRIRHARRLLREGGAPADVAQELGFADQSHFQRAFKQRVALTPRAYQRCR